MLNIAVWNENKETAIELAEQIKNLEEIESINIIDNIDSLENNSEIIKRVKNINTAFISFENNNKQAIEKAVSAAINIKEINRKCMLFLISDEDANFKEFYRPAISPCGVLRLPFKLIELSELLDEAIKFYSYENIKYNNNIIFNFKEASGRRLAFYCRDILYFETSLKKIIVQTTEQRVDFYNSLENVIAELPNYFIRCHRSFVINVNFIKSVDFKQMRIFLTNGFSVDVSRSYKSNVKNILKDKL